LNVRDAQRGYGHYTLSSYVEGPSFRRASGMEFFLR